jgi:hypothetical protein
MTTQAGDVVAQYYAAFDSHRDEWQDLVSDDVLFDGPVQHARGKAEFVTLTGQSSWRIARLTCWGGSRTAVGLPRSLSSSSMRQTGSGSLALSPSGPRWWMGASVNFVSTTIHVIYSARSGLPVERSH